LQVRYANATGGDGQNTTRTLSTRVNGSAGPQLSLPPTGSWDTWGTASTTVSLPAGTSTVTVVKNAADSGHVNLDSVALTPTATTTFPAASTALLTTGYGAGPKDALGGWSRSLDNPRTLPVPEHPGILARSGWYLLDDSRTALFSAAHVLTGEHALRRVERLHHRARERGGAAGLGDDRVRGPVQDGFVAARSDVEPERDLVAHRPGREEDGRLHPQ